MLSRRLTLAALFVCAAPVHAVTLPDGAKLEKVDFERHVMGLFGRIGLQLRLLPRLLPGQGRLPPLAVRLRPRQGLPRPDPRRPRPAARPRRPRQQPAAAQGHRPSSTTAGARFGQATPGSTSVLPRLDRRRRTPGPRAAARSSRTPLDPAGIRLRAGRPSRGRLKVDGRRSPTARRRTSPPFCDFRTNDDAVAEVDARWARSRRCGPATPRVVVSYRGNVAAGPRPGARRRPPTGFTYPQVPEVNYVDREVFAKLRAAQHGAVRAWPATPSSSAASPSTPSARLPTPDEVRAFLADTRPEQAREEDRRTARPPAARRPVGDEVLRHHRQQHRRAGEPAAAAGRAQPDVARLAPQARRRQRALRRDRPAASCRATSRDGKSPEEWLKHEKSARGGAWTRASSNELRRAGRRSTCSGGGRQPVTIEQWGEKTAAAFLGVRLECAQCHKHPFDRWTQADYRAFANIFAAVSRRQSRPRRQEAASTPRTPSAAEGQRRRQGARTRSCRSARSSSARRAAAKGRPPSCCRTRTPEAAAAEVPSAARRSRPTRARTRGAVCRVAAVAGQPVLRPQLRQPRLGPLLRRRHRRSGRRLLAGQPAVQRRGCSTPWRRTSSSTSTTSAPRADDPAVADLPALVEAERDEPLRQEQLRPQLRPADDGRGGGGRAERRRWASSENFGKDEAPPARGPSRSGRAGCRTPTVNYAFRIFGRPPRTTACDCERAMEPALPQKLFLMADPTCWPRSRPPTNRLQRRCSTAKKTDDEILDELFLATLSRCPTEKERAPAFAERLKAARRTGQAAVHRRGRGR